MRKEFDTCNNGVYGKKPSDNRKKSLKHRVLVIILSGPTITLAHCNTNSIRIQGMTGKGPLFENNLLHFSNLQWGMTRARVKSLMDTSLTCFGLNEMALGYRGGKVLEFNENYYDAMVIFYFTANRLNKICVLFEDIFNALDSQENHIYLKIKNFLSALYGTPLKAEGASPSYLWETDSTEISLHLEKDSLPFPEERTLFGFDPHVSSKQMLAYHESEEYRIRIIFQETGEQ